MAPRDDRRDGPTFHQRAYACVHVFSGERDVLLVSRPEGDWCFLCGGDHPDDASAFRVVGLGHVVERDGTLEAVLDLEDDEEAERQSMRSPWIRARVPGR